MGIGLGNGAEVLKRFSNVQHHSRTDSSLVNVDSDGGFPGRRRSPPGEKTSAGNPGRPPARWNFFLPAPGVSSTMNKQFISGISFGVDFPTGFLRVNSVTPPPMEVTPSSGRRCGPAPVPA
jgi:hypothetical protein